MKLDYSVLFPQDDYCVWTGVNIAIEVSVSPVSTKCGQVRFLSSFITSNIINRNGSLNLALAMLGNLKNWLYISSTMKNLIIHPEDPTTTFLEPIYANLTKKTVINGGVTKSELQELIITHDRVIMLGHGAPFGLLNPRQFPDAGLFIVDGSMATSLKNKSNNIYIWCHADQFVKTYGLSGLCSGMFISEKGEADLYGLDYTDTRLINQSNEKFSSILSKYINEPLDTTYRSLLYDYEVVARVNLIARFNLERLYLISDGVNKNHIKEAV